MLTDGGHGVGVPVALPVVGAGLVLLTALLHLVFALCPDVGERVFSGARGLVDGLWGGVRGPAIVALALGGGVTFGCFRRELRGMWSQWLLLGLIVLVLFSVNAMNTGIGFVANYLTQAMVEKASDTYYRWLEIYASCFIVALPVLTMQYYVRAKLGILWRSWLTCHLVEGWTSHRAYYVLNANDEKAADEGFDNPDQRIAQDIDTFTSMTLNYLIGTIDSLTSLGMNIFVLWHMNSTVTKVLVSWSIGMTAIILVLSRYLVGINYRQLKLEADFRYSLVHVRDNAESIAFYSGEASERLEIRQRLGSVVGNYNSLIIWNVGISVVSKMYTYGSVFVPFVVMGPSVLSGELTFGDFNQAQFTFRMVEGALAFIADSISSMTAWVAGVERGTISVDSEEDEDEEDQSTPRKHQRCFKYAFRPKATPHNSPKAVVLFTTGRAP
ncbi:unnamed protein product [Prorocentrum cordatum]|uniref:ABC transmembrane type-1 domain-containing protein n=1 Tax=Prorocentrum cordatum TaxID=2364126 RepID=A0ABN9RRA1_9DINO|nr:unnamed protein product [Polarella glacialis]